VAHDAFGDGIASAIDMSGDINKIEEPAGVRRMTRSEIVVLIRRDGQVLGQIDADANETGAFDTTDEQLLTAVADRLSSLYRLRLKVATAESDLFRNLFFAMTFFSIGLGADFKKLWAEGIGRLALVYVLCLFGFIIWIGLQNHRQALQGFHPHRRSDPICHVTVKFSFVLQVPRRLLALTAATRHVY
jgi:hypothetical protein